MAAVSVYYPTRVQSLIVCQLPRGLTLALSVVGGTVAGTNCGDVGGHPGTVYKIDAEYYLGRGLISPQLKAAADTACGTDWTDPLGPQCTAAWTNISIALGPFVSWQSVLSNRTFLMIHASLHHTVAEYRQC